MTGDEVGVTWNGKGITAKGFGVLALLAVLTIAGTNLWAGFRVESALMRQQDKLVEILLDSRKAQRTEHDLLRVTQERESCISTMTPEDRVRFRDRFQAGDFKRWCLWVTE